MKIDPGNYKAKIKDYGIIQHQKSGKFQVMILFGILDGPNFTYFGGLDSEKQKEFTTKNLVTLGANPTTIDRVEQGPKGGALDMEKVFELVVEDNTYNGQTNSRIKFINDPSRFKPQTKVQGSGALSDLKGIAAAMIASNPELQVTEKKAIDNVGF